MIACVTAASPRRKNRRETASLALLMHSKWFGSRSITTGSFTALARVVLNSCWWLLGYFKNLRRSHLKGQLKHGTHQWLSTNFTHILQPLTSWLNWPKVSVDHGLTNTFHLTLKMILGQVDKTSVTNNRLANKRDLLNGVGIPTVINYENLKKTC